MRLPHQTAYYRDAFQRKTPGSILLAFLFGSQVELLQYLRDIGYQVIGTVFKYQFVESNRIISTLPEIVHLNDKSGKPAGIQEHIGRRPVFACGNEDGAGDIAMLAFSQGNQYPSFQLLVNHDNSTKEFFYQEKDSASLRAAAKNRWHVVSIKKNWKRVFPSN